MRGKKFLKLKINGLIAIFILIFILTLIPNTAIAVPDDIANGMWDDNEFMWAGQNIKGKLKDDASHENLKNKIFTFEKTNELPDSLNPDGSYEDTNSVLEYILENTKDPSGKYYNIRSEEPPRKYKYLIYKSQTIEIPEPVHFLDDQKVTFYFFVRKEKLNDTYDIGKNGLILPFYEDAEYLKKGFYKDAGTNGWKNSVKNTIEGDVPSDFLGSEAVTSKKIPFPGETSSERLPQTQENQLCFWGDVEKDSSVDVPDDRIEAGGGGVSGDGVWIVRQGDDDAQISKERKNVEKNGTKFKYDRFCYGSGDFGSRHLEIDKKYAIRYFRMHPLTKCAKPYDGAGTCDISLAGRVIFKIILKEDKSGYLIKIEETIPSNARLNGKTFDVDKMDGADYYLHKNRWLDIKIKQTIKDPVKDAIAGALDGAVQNLAKAIQGTVVYFANWINETLNSPEILKDDTYLKIWVIIRNFSIALLALVVIIVAFSNVFSVGIEKFGAAKLIPKMVIAIALTYFSYFIVQAMLDLAGALSSQIYSRMCSGALDAGGETKCQGIATDAILYASDTGLWDGLAGLLVITFLLLILLGVLLYIGILMYVRIIAINLLTVLAPIAFILGIVPWTESLTSKWWSEVSKWIFMGPAILFLLMVGNIIIMSAAEEGADPFLIVTAAVAYFMAAQIPVQMGGKGMSAVAGAVKKPLMGLGNAVLKKPVIGAGKGIKNIAADKTGLSALSKAYKRRSALREQRQTDHASNITGGLATSGSSIKRWMSGATKDQVPSLRAEMVRNKAKDFSEVNVQDSKAMADKRKEYSDKNDLIGVTAIDQATSAKGNWDSMMKIYLGANEEDTQEKKKERKKAWAKEYRDSNPNSTIHERLAYVKKKAEEWEIDLLSKMAAEMDKVAADDPISFDNFLSNHPDIAGHAISTDTFTNQYLQAGTNEQGTPLSKIGSVVVAKQKGKGFDSTKGSVAQMLKNTGQIEDHIDGAILDRSVAQGLGSMRTWIHDELKAYIATGQKDKSPAMDKFYKWADSVVLRDKGGKDDQSTRLLKNIRDEIAQLEKDERDQHEHASEGTPVQGGGAPHAHVPVGTPAQAAGTPHTSTPGGTPVQGGGTPDESTPEGTPAQRGNRRRLRSRNERTNRTRDIT